MSDVVAIDWSGRQSSAAARQHIWLAHARRGSLVELANGRTRPELIDSLIDLKRSCPNGLVVGLDFSFSFPAWFVRQRGHRSAPEVWHDVAVHGEEWLDTCEPPFWGKKGDRRPQSEQLRQTERASTVGRRTPKSTFQIRGAGTVGTGSLRGMPALLELQASGFSIWPFDPPRLHAVLELYPRLCTGPVNKRSPEARAAFLGDAPGSLTATQRQQAIGSEDAFDAAISALVMDAHGDQLRSLHQTDDPVTLLEGRIWDPRSIG